MLCRGALLRAMGGAPLVYQRPTERLPHAKGRTYYYYHTGFPRHKNSCHRIEKKEGRMGAFAVKNRRKRTAAAQGSGELHSPRSPREFFPNREGKGLGSSIGIAKGSSVWAPVDHEIATTN